MYYRDNRETLLMIIVWFKFEYRPSLVGTLVYIRLLIYPVFLIKGSYQLSWFGVGWMIVTQPIWFFWWRLGHMRVCPIF